METLQGWRLDKVVVSCLSTGNMVAKIVQASSMHGDKDENN